MTEVKFADLGVIPEIVKGLQEEGIYNPTEIQQMAIPAIHEGKDVIGISRTGSGKTASFGIPLLEKVQVGKGVQGLVLAPTRELAVQIGKEFEKWGKFKNVKVATVFGGVALDPQAERMHESEIVVATPGRLLDHLQRRNVDFTKLNYFVLDEADKMIEMGFLEPIEAILSYTPPEKQIILFGATISSEIDHIKEKYMDNVATVEAALHVKKDLLEQYYYDLRPHEKFSMLVHLLKKEDMDKAIIFCSKRSTVELVHQNLRNHNIRAQMIHGKMRQNKRLATIDLFNSGKANILVASAVAARGLDIKGVTHVFNYDLSKDPQEYVHRVGRTARAGESGKAFTLLCEYDHDAFRQIFSRYDIDAVELPREKFEKLQFTTRPRKPQGRFHRSNQNQRHNRRRY